MKKIKIIKESELANRFAKRILKEYSEKRPIEDFFPMDDKVEDHYKGRPDVPQGYVDDEILIQKLVNAKQMGEWHLVDEVIIDLRYR
tara:strand:+ start:627 stop:887 length:261 start_codon:yes stop_codon:yes gene_type:complete